MNRSAKNIRANSVFVSARLRILKPCSGICRKAPTRPRASGERVRSAKDTYRYLEIVATPAPFQCPPSGSKADAEESGSFGLVHQQTPKVKKQRCEVPVLNKRCRPVRKRSEHPFVADRALFK